MKIAAVAACPVIGGKLARVDDSKASAMNGVRQIVRLENAVAVIADHMWAAKKGLAALDIVWDEGENAHVSTADIVKRLEDAANGPAVVAKQEGDVAKAMAGAVKIVEAIYEAPFLAHATMEPMNCTAHVRKDGCDVWVGTQVVTRARAAAATAAGLPLEKVRIHNQLLGGGFGRRLDVDYVTQAVRDRQTGRLSREGHLEPRRGHSARRLSPLLLRPPCRRPGRKGFADRLEPPRRRLVGRSPLVAGGIS